MSIGEARRDAAAQASRVEIFPQSVLGQAKEVQSLLREVDRNWPVALQPEADDPTKLDSSLDVFPNLFVDAFVGVSDSDLQIVALATRLLSTALLLGDRAMDGDSKGESLARNLLRAQAMNFEAQFTFCRALGADSGFWRSYRECLVQYAGACVEERPAEAETTTAAPLHAQAPAPAAIGRLVRVQPSAAATAGSSAAARAAGKRRRIIRRARGRSCRLRARTAPLPRPRWRSGR